VREGIKYRFRVSSVAVFTLYSYSKALEYRFRVSTAGSLRAGGVFKRAPPPRFEAGPTAAFLGLGGNSWSHLRPKRVGPVDFSCHTREQASTIPARFYCLSGICVLASGYGS
jgi:hypothetical protein